MFADLKIRPVQPLSKLLLQLHLCPSVHRPSLLPLLLSFFFLSCCRCFGCQLLLRALDPLADRPRDLQTYVRSTIATADIHERFQPLHSGQKDTITHLRSIHSLLNTIRLPSRDCLPRCIPEGKEWLSVRPSAAEEGADAASRMPWLPPPRRTGSCGPDPIQSGQTGNQSSEKRATSQL